MPPRSARTTTERKLVKAATPLTAVSGAVFGYLIGTVIRNNKLAAGGYPELHSTQFMLAIIGAYVGAGLSAVVYAKWKFLPAVFLGWMMFLIAIIWSI
jgi:hypothetical protein